MASVLDIFLEDKLPIDQDAEVLTDKLSEEEYNSLQITLKSIKKMRKRIEKSNLPEEGLSSDEQRNLQIKSLNEAFSLLDTLAKKFGGSLNHCLQLTIEKKIRQAKEKSAALQKTAALQESLSFLAWMR